MSSNTKPLLSICIPTYNRAELLRSALYSVVRQAAELNGQVEVVVSDNCSPDHTPEVLAWAQTLGPVRSHRNAENVGFGRNFLRLAQELAEGEYCWVLGDDDVLCEGAVAELVSALTSHPEIDYVFVNNSFQDKQEPEQPPQSVPKTYSCFVREQRVVDRWEQIIGMSDNKGLFTYVGSHILRTRLWREHQFDFLTDTGYPSLEATFPHACLVARHMTGKPALYIGKPLINVFMGAQEWMPYFPLISLVRSLELGQYIAAQGAEPSMAARYQDLVMRKSSGCLWQLLRDPNVEGKQYLKLGSLYRRYWKHPAFYRMLLAEPAKTLLVDPLRRFQSTTRQRLRRSPAV